MIVIIHTEAGSPGLVPPKPTVRGVFNDTLAAMQHVHDQVGLSDDDVNRLNNGQDVHIDFEDDVLSMCFVP